MCLFYSKEAFARINFTCTSMLLCFCADTLILQGCSAESTSAGVITVSCNSSHQIQVTSTCYSNSNCDLLTKTANGGSPLYITGLDDTEMCTIMINVFNNGQVVMISRSVIIEHVKVVSSATGEFSFCCV